MKPLVLRSWLILATCAIPASLLATLDKINKEWDHLDMHVVLYALLENTLNSIGVLKMADLYTPWYSKQCCIALLMLSQNIPQGIPLLSFYFLAPSVNIG